MHVVILLAGVVDPKRPLPPPAGGDWRALRSAAGLVYKLSPFDEAALEVGLKWRIAHPDTVLTVLVTDGCGDLALMRTVAAFKPDHMLGVPRPLDEGWDVASLARRIMEALASLPQMPDLVLTGREHGDTDDGVAAPFVAQKLGWAYAGLALDARWENGTLTCSRVMGDAQETLCLPTPAVLSISNDKGNRLRHPLMKNILYAKQQTFATAAPEPGPVPVRSVVAHAAPTPESFPGDVPCRLLTGSLQDQARELANYLKPWSHQTERYAAESLS